MASGSRRGFGRERKLCDLMEADGWTIIRAASGPVDHIALRHGETPLLIQCKSTVTPYAHFGPADRIELRRLAVQAGADAWLVWWPKNARQPTWIPSSEWPGKPQAVRRMVG